MSMYDTMYSFSAILLGSLVTDNHHLTDTERVNFMASGKILNLVSAFLVAKIGLNIFDEDDMPKFRVFLVSLSAIVTVLFLVAQAMTHYNIFIRWKSFKISFLDIKHEKPSTHNSSEKLKPRQVFKDFWLHDNFWAWIWMELLLEAQNSFYGAFLKTFVDQLLHDEGVSRERCDWLLSVSRPLGLILAILCYIPIGRMGYKKVYFSLFAVNFVMSAFMLLTATHQSTTSIAVFLVIYPAITSAVVSAGFHL
jgi:Na+/melibiose symporter-like transporter